MNGADDDRSAERMLRDLSGGVLDLRRLEADFDEISNFIRAQKRLWELDIQTSGPAAVFSASWERFDFEP